jgi:hypothetical protein
MPPGEDDHPGEGATPQGVEQGAVLETPELSQVVATVRGMTTDERTTQDESAAQPQRVEEFHAEPDSVLALLVDVINRTGGLEVGVTLHVSGTLVSGSLVSGRAYFDLVHERVVGDGEDEGGVRAALGGVFERFSESYRDREGTRDDDEDPPAPFRRTVYVHLRDAKVYAPGTEGTIGVDLWRGRLTHLSGWSMGTLAVG